MQLKFPIDLTLATHLINGTKFDTQGHVIRLVVQLILIMAALYLSGDLNFSKSST